MTLAAMYKTDYVQTLDQHSQANLNSSWFNDKGAYLFLQPCLFQLTEDNPSSPPPFFLVVHKEKKYSRNNIKCFSARLFLFSLANVLFFVGAWMTNVIIVCLIKFFFGIVPGMSPELVWTMTTLTYNIVSGQRSFLGFAKKTTLFLFCDLSCE